MPYFQDGHPVSSLSFSVKYRWPPCICPSGSPLTDKHKSWWIRSVLSLNWRPCCHTGKMAYGCQSWQKKDRIRACKSTTKISWGFEVTFFLIHCLLGWCKALTFPWFWQGWFLWKENLELPVLLTSQLIVVLICTSND